MEYKVVGKKKSTKEFGDEIIDKSFRVGMTNCIWSMAKTEKSVKYLEKIKKN